MWEQFNKILMSEKKESKIDLERNRKPVKLFKLGEEYNHALSICVYYVAFCEGCNTVCSLSCISYSNVRQLFC